MRVPSLRQALATVMLLTSFMFWPAPVIQAQGPPDTFLPMPRAVLPQWQFEPGPHNDITDVPGVAVGHYSLWQDHPHVLRTGITAIVPHAGNLATEGVWANGMMLNGNGELTGLTFVQTSGILNSPLMLTNTFAVGAVHTGVFQYFQQRYPGDTPGTTTWTGLLPVVGECYDGYFNTIEDLDALRPEDAGKALAVANGGPVAQGRVGAGSGMRSFELHAGIGSASRRVMLDGKPYVLGVLVNANHSRFAALNPQVKAALESVLGQPLEAIRERDARDQVVRKAALPEVRQGSIMVVIATNAPLLPHELGNIAQRAALGIGAMGSAMDTSSGDGIIAFSTAFRLPVGDHTPTRGDTPFIHPDALTPLYRATVEAVTEAQMNALLYSHRPPESP